MKSVRKILSVKTRIISRGIFRSQLSNYHGAFLARKNVRLLAVRSNHLKELVDKVPSKSDIEIGLLIGANCAKVLEPQEVIPNKNGGPFA